MQKRPHSLSSRAQGRCSRPDLLPVPCGLGGGSSRGFLRLPGPPARALRPSAEASAGRCLATSVPSAGLCLVAPVEGCVLKGQTPGRPGKPWSSCEGSPWPFREHSDPSVQGGAGWALCRGPGRTGVRFCWPQTENEAVVPGGVDVWLWSWAGKALPGSACPPAQTPACEALRGGCPGLGGPSLRAWWTGPPERRRLPPRVERR